MGWVAEKLALFAHNLERFAGPAVRDTVMAGSDELGEPADVDQLARWMQGALERLCARADPTTVRQIMTHNACRFREETFLGDTVGALAELKAVYEETGDIDEIIRRMNADRSFQGASMFPRYERQGRTLLDTKRPCRPAEFAAARDPFERQRAYCYCPLVRAAREKIPPVYCHCGAAFGKYIWEEIVPGEVETEVLESILDGGTCCRFAIHLPDPRHPGGS